MRLLRSSSPFDFVFVFKVWIFELRIIVFDLVFELFMVLIIINKVDKLTSLALVVNFIILLLIFFSLIYIIVWNSSFY